MAIYDEIGNVTGEGEPNQTLNVHGLIALRMGDYAQAEKLFEDYMHLSDASRFIRESHQGYRNLGLCHLSLAMGSAGYGNKAIESFRKSLGCMGLDPDRLVFAPDEELWKSAAIFNTLYNYGRALVVCLNHDKDTVMEILKRYNDEARLKELLGQNAWNWRCRLLALLCQAETDQKRAEDYAKEMFGIYEQRGIAGIQKLRFGPQNYNENVEAVMGRLPGLVWGDAPPERWM